VDLQKFITRFPKDKSDFWYQARVVPEIVIFVHQQLLWSQKDWAFPEELVEHMYLLQQKFPNLSHNICHRRRSFSMVRNISEKLKKPWESHPDRRNHWTGLPLDQWIFREICWEIWWDAIAEIGIGVLFIGVESKFGDLLNIKKRSVSLIQNLYLKSCTVWVSHCWIWICGWIFITRQMYLRILIILLLYNPPISSWPLISLPGNSYGTTEKGKSSSKCPVGRCPFLGVEHKRILHLKDHET